MNKEKNKWIQGKQEQMEKRVNPISIVLGVYIYRSFETFNVMPSKTRVEH